MELSILFFAVLFGSVLAAHQIYDANVSSQCVENCYKNQTDFGDICRAIETDCYEKCEYGCYKWKESLNSSCQLVCNSATGSLTPLQLYCMVGCNDGVSIFQNKMQSHLGEPPPPVLVADSLTSNSLQLEWNYDKAVMPGLKYLIQWKYEEVPNDWQFYKKTNWRSKDNIFTIENLQPYTKYRFRVAILIYQLSKPVFSAQSVIMMTLPQGAPRSAPVLVRAVPVDCTRISVSWTPGPFPNGPILSYVVGLIELETNVSAFKDVPGEKTSDIIGSLKPGCAYNVSVQSMNSDGTGPAAFATVITPLETTVKDIEGPVLIIGTDKEIVEQGVEITDEPIVLYNNTDNDGTIKGVAIHVERKLLFVSDSTKHIYKMPLSRVANTQKTAILTPNEINNQQPLDLSVDWLNEQIYVLVERAFNNSSVSKMWSIMRSDFYGQGLTVAVGTLPVKPHHMEVDPYNGYLFWILNQGSESKLYKLDLSDISNGIKHENHPELIFSEKNLGAFIVDHTNFKLLVSNQENKTVNSVSLDGKEVHDIRPKISNSILETVISLATANKKFYWTDGSQVFYEEYHAKDEIYFHNSFSALMKATYLKVIINMPNSQPVPVPVNNPTQIQAIFGSSRMKASWKAPHLLGGQGKGAWQNWSYEISIRNASDDRIRVYDNITATSFTISDLRHDTEYVVKAAAYTPPGKGPWSTEFTGRTLKRVPNFDRPMILWSASNGLSKSDVIGENMETLIDESETKGFHFVSSTWFRDEAYLLTNTSEVFVYNLTSHQRRFLPKLDNDIKSIAIDWIGRRLYWSKQQWIMRANLTGGNKEPPIAAPANELVIDSLRAYLYWSTGYAITCSRLNGDTQLKHYYVDKEFSGKRVMGLTLDTENNFVYWIVRGSEGSNLFKGPLAGTGTFVEDITPTVFAIHKSDVKGYLSYFDNRFLWQQDDDTVIISNLEGKNLAVVNTESLSDLQMVNVIDPSLRRIPSKLNVSLNDINVIPDVVAVDSIQVIGSWDLFNITWKPVENVNYGTVFYEVKFSDAMVSLKLDEPNINYLYSVAPFSKIQIWIRACTNWTCAPQILASVHSPSSPPSEPKNLRSFVTFKRKFDVVTNVTITLRWEEPRNLNGVIERYKISRWIFKNGTMQNSGEDYTVADSKEYVLTDVAEDFVHFDVQACTNSEGSIAPIQVNATVENPIPTLIVAEEDSIYLQDMDRNLTKHLNGINTPLEIALLIDENKLFWVNDMNELFVYNLETKTRNKLFDMDDNVLSLSMDWLERSLYYVQRKGDEDGSRVYKLDLNLLDRNIVKPILLFRRQSIVSKLEVSPYTRKIYWIETDQNETNVLMESDGTNIRPFFNRQQQLPAPSSNDKRRFDECNCSASLSIEKTFAVDHTSTTNRPKFVFVADSTNVIASDRFGCRCEPITTIPVGTDVSSIKSERDRLYWLDQVKGELYMFTNGSGKPLSKAQPKAREILIFGSHVQPYPSRRCLTPKFDPNLTPTLTRRTSSSLTLNVPEIKAGDGCDGVSVATIEYKLYYKPYYGEDWGSSKCDEECVVVTAFDRNVTIDGLKPYSKYLVFLGVRNYYSGDEDVEGKRIGNGTVFETAIGAPSNPRNVTVTVLNPTLLRVTWLPPEEFNGDTIYYEIHWQTEATSSGIRKKGEQIVMENDVGANQEPLTADLRKMSQNETYLIWVRAYSINNESSDDSHSIQITSFPEPDNITLLNSTAYSLKLYWMISEFVDTYFLQYAPLTSNDWFLVPEDWIEMDLENRSIFINVDELKPKTQYKFRFILIYPEDGNDYVWPEDGRFVFETKGDRPTAPGKPEYRSINRNESKIWWQPSRDNGAPVELYKLEGMKMRNYREKRSSTNRTAWSYGGPTVEETEFEWEEFYNGSETYWKVEGLTDDYRYSFRALALNEYGWSEPSDEMEFDPTTAALLADKPDPLTMILIAICTPVVILVLVTCTCMLCCRWDCGDAKKDAHVIVPIGRPDVELATLRELPRRSNFVQNTNVLYVSAQPTPEEIKLLPHIRRDQISLTKFLGSGAFGEVYEGKARGVANTTTEIKVAVKTLRKGASDQEKTEFLQEAQLMSHFKHEHILQLLGVCLDNDPHYIIMELMEGGDLLTYLRASRNISAPRTPPLTLTELLKMCLDVTTGCRYLEEMHFVHRDLACRNCLVSSVEPASRVVKIGDFGLARDIYKNDYYRKEGEGLLPVRWMAPESLVDGVFTSQSDVWSFGVLLWEIMTLGQQPYPARNNLEVLHYVRRGGRLGKPIDCPEKLYELMLLCWSFEPEGRPTFKYCLETLTKLKGEISSSSVTSAHCGQYISTVVDQLEGVSNQIYFQDLNHNDSGTSWKSEDTNGEIMPFLNSDQSVELSESQLSEEIPKYLEIVYDANEEDNDGYEIPRKDVLSSAEIEVSEENSDKTDRY